MAWRYCFLMLFSIGLLQSDYVYSANGEQGSGKVIAIGNFNNLEGDEEVLGYDIDLWEVNWPGKIFQGRDWRSSIGNSS
jgi:hypothetical protein